MSPRSKGKKKAPSVSQTTRSLPVLHPHAAGIGIGTREIYVAMPPASDVKPVRAFALFTEDFRGLRAWLKESGMWSESGRKVVMVTRFRFLGINSLKRQSDTKWQSMTGTVGFNPHQNYRTTFARLKAALRVT